MKVFPSHFLLRTTALIAVFLLQAVVARASSTAVSGGSPVTLTATADGTDPFTYQWYKDGDALVGATSTTYNISNFQAANEGTYTAVISNSAGSTTTDDAVLTLALANVIPAFTTQPSSQTVTAGGGVTFTAAASGTPAPTFQWQKNGMNLIGATSATYTLSSTVVGDAGSYAVVATNSAGVVTSNTASLTVNVPNVAPSFTTQPTSQTVTAGSAVTFIAAASGTPTPTFQWQKNGSNISGATSTSYTLSSTVVGDAGSYTVIATNAASAVTSNTATLTVNVPAVAPAITTHPASQTATAGSSVTFTVAASGTPAPTYQWRRNGANLSGATSASYTMTNVSTSNGATYTVIATNSAGSITSNGALLTINTAPAFTTQPVSQSVTAGGAVTFTAAASGTPAPAYQWKKDGSNISGATSASYTLSSVTTGDGGSYTVIATNSVSSVTSNTATLTVSTGPAFTTQPTSQTVTAGTSVTFTAAASGTPSPTYQWKKGGSNIFGATSASYTLSSVTTGNAGSYTVVATNSVSSVTSNTATLTVNAAPTFTTQPASQTVTAGTSVTFTAAASGTPAPTFQWLKNGVNIIGATNASYTLSSTVTGDAGSYTVVATNSVSAVTSNAATLTVNAATAAPVFTTQPASQTVTAGTSVTFTAAASGTPAPTFQWLKNGVNIIGATNSSYTLSSAVTGDAGSYTVAATNSVSTVTSNAATLTVNAATAAPVFTTQPASQSAIAGASVTFTAAASGTPSPTFQWKKGGANISGATSASYTLSGVASGNAGSYTVVATNSAGAATSNSATLTVNPVPAAPIFTTQPASQSVIVGGSVTFNAVASGTPSPTFQWKKDDVAIIGATSASFTIPTTTINDEASYTVVATNPTGTVTSTEATLSVLTPPKNIVVTLTIK